MTDVATTLNEALFAQLQLEKLTLLHTIDAESGAPTSSAISWIYAKSPETVRFALDQRSRLIENMKKNPAVSLTIFAANTVNIVQGKASVVTDALDEVPFKLTCFDVSIEAVRDGMFYGARISTEPEYEKTYDKRAAEKLDQQVFAAMKKA
ncbi:hypothetical protein DUZ99_05230 [Xylanibacillus composti]|uniref:Pyridoxamine 5'-phosphate oxidase N-terminal domain-containing protein n=1 Tax=Xylanibacillus composti TaxID=1572762 RepID=A0A8J4M1E3_9BACL|nr:pyridoxamine 5'-phosphate oxidase family protein [Xylanibacillus composti]MDT9724390.1 hypothetical protein [Xylanibacillus composti]GIQ67985.1 hypothetical protein XYCOK13_08090 [Xylanibacillus composti]